MGVTAYVSYTTSSAGKQHITCASCPRPPTHRHVSLEKAALQNCLEEALRERGKHHLLGWRRLLAKPTVCIAPPVGWERSGVQDRHGGTGAGFGLLSWPAAEPALAPGRHPSLVVWLSLRPRIPVSTHDHHYVYLRVCCLRIGKLHCHCQNLRQREHHQRCTIPLNISPAWFRQAYPWRTASRLLSSRVLGRPEGSAARGLPAEQLRGLARGRQHVASARRHRVHLRPAAWQLLHTDSLLASSLMYVSCAL